MVRLLFDMTEEGEARRQLRTAGDAADRCVAPYWAGDPTEYEWCRGARWSDVWVGGMYVTKPGANPRFDHLWGHGSVAPDPTSPSTLVCMWTTC